MEWGTRNLKSEGTQKRMLAEAEAAGRREKVLRRKVEENRTVKEQKQVFACWDHVNEDDCLAAVTPFIGKSEPVTDLAVR